MKMRSLSVDSKLRYHTKATESLGELSVQFMLRNRSMLTMARLRIHRAGVASKSLKCQDMDPI